ncbi:hypothetical protein LOD99_7762 [Oopsacas minuta]|uniref:Uncharacterized protein n=1 Tax=Oopsacas minuta TaxID=111878 RepID=A0AAV7JQT4_9METZ|nr:hypothetical protein LOD99_7762 [Oopsacas minuta]
MATNELPSYPINSNPGLGIIIVNKFENIPSYTRRGAEKEVENLTRIFSMLGLETRLFEDLTSHQIIEVLYKTSKDPELSSQSMLVLAISSHGNEEGLFGINIEQRLKLVSESRSTQGLNDVISTNKIQCIFNTHNCPLLQSKPKLLILNGCRGSEKEGLYGYETDGVSEDTKHLGCTLWSDFLVVWSAVDGYQSVRHIATGSVFISVLCEVLDKFSEYSTELLLPVVNQKLMERTTRFCEKENRIVAECCVWTSTLKKQLCLHSVKSTNAGKRLSFEEAISQEIEEFPSIDSLHSISINSLTLMDSLTQLGGDPITCVAIVNTTFLDVTRETPSKLLIGDRVFLLDSLDSKKNLLFIRRVSSIDTGYVPRNVIKPDENLQEKQWFYEGLDKKTTSLYLTPCPDGTFLIRSSLINPSHYRLAIVHQQKVHQYKIKYLLFDWTYILSIYNFTSLHNLVVYLSGHKRVCCKLSHPFILADTVPTNVEDTI